MSGNTSSPGVGYQETLPSRACEMSCVCVPRTKWNVHYVSSEKGKWTQAKGVPQTRHGAMQDLQWSCRWTDQCHCRSAGSLTTPADSVILHHMCLGQPVFEGSLSLWLRMTEKDPCSTLWTYLPNAPPAAFPEWGLVFRISWPNLPTNMTHFCFSTSTDLTRLIVTKSDQKWMIRKSKHQKYKNKNKNRKREFVIRILCPIFSDIEARKSYVVDSYWYRKNGIFIYKENGHSLKSYPLLILYEISTDSININVITRSVRLYEIIMRILMFSTRILMLFTHWLWCPSQIFYSKGGVCQQWAIFSVCK